MPGQPEVGTNPWLTMDCTGCNLSSGGLPSTLIIDPGQSFTIDTTFVLAGFVAPGLIALAAALPGNDFQVEYYCESLGPGNEQSLGQVSFSAVATQLTYGAAETTVTVPSGILSPGVYKIVTVVRTLIPLLGFCTGFHEGPTIQQR